MPGLLGSFSSFCFFPELFIMDDFRYSPWEEEINSLCEARAHVPLAVTKQVTVPFPTDLLEFRPLQLGILHSGRLLYCPLQPD